MKSTTEVQAKGTALFDLTGKSAVVVGGASGLGKAMAASLAAAGAEVMVADLNLESARQTSEEISQNGQNHTHFKINVTNSKDAEEMVKKAVGIYGKIDILVESAGLTITGTPMIDYDEEMWNKIMDVNLKGMFFVNQAVARQMKGQRCGRIINVGSMSSVIINNNPYGSSGVYCTSKGGVINLTKAFASDLAPYNITVNAISPGYMKTPLSASFWANPEDSADKCAKIPMGRPGEPEELAGIVVYLASDASSYMTGANLIIDGGYTVW